MLKHVCFSLFSVGFIILYLNIFEHLSVTQIILMQLVSYFHKISLRDINECNVITVDTLKKSRDKYLTLNT